MSSANLHDLMEARFAHHERQAKEQGDQVRGDIQALAKDAAERHSAVLGILALHTTKLELHDHRIATVEKVVDENEKDMKQARGDWKRLLLGILATLATMALGGLVGRLLLPH
jgi:hypothetical protein